MDEVIRVSLKNTEAHFLKGSIHLLRGEGFLAIGELRTVVNDRPEFILGHIRLAEAHAMIQEFPLATDTLLKVLKVMMKTM